MKLTKTTIVAVLIAAMFSVPSVAEEKFNKENYCDYIAEFSGNVMHLRQSEGIPQRKIEDYIPINGTYERQLVRAAYGQYQYSPGASRILTKRFSETSWKECNRYFHRFKGGLAKEKYMREWNSHKE